MISKQYTQLKGEDKNLVLAAAHIEDAKTGRYTYAPIVSRGRLQKAGLFVVLFVVVVVFPLFQR